MGSHKNKVARAVDLCEKVKIIIPSFETRMDFVIKVLQEKRYIRNGKKKKR